MATTEATADAKTARRVRFRGSQYIEYDAEQATVVRLCGAQRQHRGGSATSGDASSSSSALAVSLRLECEARGIAVEKNADDLSTLQQALSREYVRELRGALHARGFLSTAASPSASDAGNAEDMAILERQLQVAELLLVQVALLPSAEVEASADSGDGTKELSAQALAQLQLAKKELKGQVDEGYAFGRRFYSVESYINSLEFDELVEIAQNRALAIPDIPETERKEITVVERELCAKHSTTGAGKPLKQLTLRELMVEAHARELTVGNSRDTNGKRSKKGLIEKLRPVIRQEVLEEKILDKRDDLLRLLLLDVLEKEAAQDRSRALLQLIQTHLKRLQQTHVQMQAADENGAETSTCPEAMDVGGSSNPVADTGAGVGSAASGSSISEQLQHSFALLTRLQACAAHVET